MKKVILLLSFSFLILGTTFSQFASRQSKFVKSADILAGFVPNKDYNALKFDLAVSNMLFKVVGFYTSFEVGVTSDYFTNTWGINVSVLKFLYLYAGVDLFTSYGIIQSMNENPMDGVRKELGIGLYPFNNLSIRIGYSIEVGIAITAGYRIQFNKKKSKFKQKRNNRDLPAYFRNLD